VGRQFAGWLHGFIPPFAHRFIYFLLLGVPVTMTVFLSNPTAPGAPRLTRLSHGCGGKIAPGVFSETFEGLHPQGPHSGK
jgi:hypothetical protein